MGGKEPLRRDRVEALEGHAPDRGHQGRAHDDHRELACRAGPELAPVHPARHEVAVAQQFQPLAATATHIHDGPRQGAGPALLEQRQVNRLALLDDPTRPAELVLEGE